MHEPWRRLAALTALLCGCAAGGAAGSASPTPEPPRAQTTELRVGTSGDYAPFSVRDATGKLAGFDVEIAEMMGQDLGFEPRWVGFHWPELGKALATGTFDVAMSGVSWNPKRAVTGYMTRSVGRAGPCVLGDAQARSVAVNHGGILEGWARGHFAGRELVTVDDNRSLPELLAQGRVGAIVTDSFERRAFARPGWAVRCEPARWQKAYWVRSRELGTRLDAWLRANTKRVEEAQERWFGERQKLDANSHLVDLLARRLAFMPLVASLKAQKNLPIEDLPREREVLAQVGESAKHRGLPEPAVVALFALQIELSKAVQRRQSEASSLDLKGEIRPALNEIGDRILDALAEARTAGRLGSIELNDLELLAPWLTSEERAELVTALRAVA